MDTYKITRHFQDTRKPSEVIRTGLSLEVAQAHCQNPATRGGNAEDGSAWLDGYDVEPRTFEGYAQTVVTENGDFILDFGEAVAAICSSTFGGNLVAFVSGPGGGLFAEATAPSVAIDVAPSALVQGF